MFGFSRGTYSARSLVSMLHEVGGVLKKPADGYVTKASVEEAFKLYRNDMKPCHPVMKAFAKNCYPVRVKLVGMWDTVGVLGVPDSAFKSNTWYAPVLNLISNTPLSRKNYIFHDQDLSCIVDEAYQALAIDEYREDFDPTLRGKMTPENKKLEQCWFVDSHSNCGGGIVGDDLRQLSYEWMQDKAIANGSRYKWTYKASEQRPHWRTELEDSFRNKLGGAYAWIKEKEHSRVIGQSVGELQHWSVKLRPQNNSKYSPKGLGTVDDSSGEMKQFRSDIPYTKPPVVLCSFNEDSIFTSYSAERSSSGCNGEKKTS